MKLQRRHLLAGAAIAALMLPAFALAQKPAQQKQKPAQKKPVPTQTAPAPKLSESTTSGFPDKAFLLTLGATQALNASKVDVTVARDGSTGTAPTGTVDLVKADGTKVATGALTGGKVSLTLPADLPVGTHVMTAKYLGGGGFAPGSANVTVTVKAAPVPPAGKSESTTTATIKPKKPSFKENFKAIVKVKAADGSEATGNVVLKLDGAWLGKRMLDDGRIVYKVRKDLEVGKHKLVAVYKGSPTVEGSRDKVTFKVVR